MSTEQEMLGFIYTRMGRIWQGYPHAVEVFKADERNSCGAKAEAIESHCVNSTLPLPAGAERGMSG